MNGQPIAIAGIPLPSDAPLFLAIIALHVAAGLGAVVAGATAMLSRKRPGRHPLMGTLYFSALAVVFATMAVISAVRWAEDYHLFVLGGEIIHGFAFTLLVGVIVGTYSSIYIASPIVLYLDFKPRGRAKAAA